MEMVSVNLVVSKSWRPVEAVVGAESRTQTRGPFGSSQTLPDRISNGDHPPRVSGNIVGILLEIF